MLARSVRSSAHNVARARFARAIHSNIHICTPACNHGPAARQNLASPHICGPLCNHASHQAQQAIAQAFGSRGLSSSAKGRVPMSLWDDSKHTAVTAAVGPAMQDVFKGNEKWVQTMTQNNPNYFKDLAALPQRPKWLYIGCADSRVLANEITGTGPGELFVHRNIGNVVQNNDVSMLSTLQFAVDVLGIKHIMVVGHYGCGAVQASLTNKDFGLVEHWLKNIRDVARLHTDALAKCETQEARVRRLVELNVQEQVLNVLKTTVIQRKMQQDGVSIHGLVYDLADGKLSELDVDLKGYVNKHSSIYTLYQKDPDA